jgi:hypothetical protein
MNLLKICAKRAAFAEYASKLRKCVALAINFSTAC